jgi:hypothetical protein
MLSAERDVYPPTAAFPSFHVLWSIFIGRLYRPRILGILYVLVIATTCITTGMHYIPDILASLVIAPLFMWPNRVWRVVRRAAERLGNSRRVWRIGPARAALAGVVQMSVVLIAAGAGHEWKAFTTGVAALAGAALWARPFGFYGGLVAVMLACLLFENRWTLLGAHCVAAPWMLAILRLRCPAPIHPAHFYSIAGSVVLGLILARLWMSGGSLAMVAGVFAIGTGLARFVEEAYRGEPQTRRLGGLRTYQWIAIALVVAGAVLTTLPSPAPPALQWSWGSGFAYTTSMRGRRPVPRHQEAIYGHHNIRQSRIWDPSSSQ